MNNLNNIANLSFIGSGISTSFTILNFLDKLEKGTPLKNKLLINIIDKYDEFNTGIPYGSRSGFSTLLITSLKNFLPEPELSEFKIWLNENISWLLKEYKKESGVLSNKWLELNIDDINNQNWDDLFIPRRFFGCYLNLKVKSKIEALEKVNKINVNYISGKVFDITKTDTNYTVLLENDKTLVSEKVILSVGSLPVNNLWKDKKTIEKEELLFINTPYDPDLNSTLERVSKYLIKRGDNKTNILIIGANASALEILYKLNDHHSKHNALNDFVFLSTQGRAPDAVIDEARKKDFVPINLVKLKEEKDLNADRIAEAAFKDIDLSDRINLGAASTVDTISSAFGILLDKLNSKELEKFACQYGNEIGKRQRCAGVHYSTTIELLKAENRFEHVAGRFSNLIKTDDEKYLLEYINTETKKEQLFEEPFHMIFNCIGGKNLLQKDVPKIISNLIEKNFCKPNESNIGFHVNEDMETIPNLHIMGPLLAGNVIDNKAIWHVEHCGRIIWLSKKLSSTLYDYYVAKDNILEKAAKLTHCNTPIEVITEKEDWDLFLKETDNYDFYHTYDYHKLSLIEDETAIILKYSENNILIGIPLIIRNIKGTVFKDATSVYGYVGPISKGIATNFDNSNFINEINIFCHKNNIISVFTRLNPYINNQSLILNDFGEKISQGKIINIDLSLSLKIQRQNYRSRLKTHINKARRNCTVKLSNSNNDLKKFIKLYHENMDRVNAKKFYYFNEAYFESLMKSNDFEANILSVIENNTGEVIASSLFISANSILHYHLSGCKDDSLHLTPTKLLIDEMRIIATEKKYTFFNLGGGLGGRDDDSLFHFKESFSKDFKNFNLWKWIVNEEVYNQLVLQKGIIDKETNYFPLYRTLDDINVTL